MSQTIPNLTAAIALDGTEQYWAVQAATDVRVTTAQLVASANGSGAVPFVVSVGGTGAATFTPYGVVYGNGTSALQQVAVGTTGQFLSGNTGAAPSWADFNTMVFTYLSGLPTSLPGSAGQLWWNGGVLCMS